MDDFLIEYCRSLKPKDFIAKAENIGRKKKEKREYLNIQQTTNLVIKLDDKFETVVEIPR